MTPYEKLLAAFRFPRAKNPNPKTPMEVLIHHLQRKAWDHPSLIGRLYDPTFPYSGIFDPPREIEEAIARSLMLAGNVVGRPIITKESIVDEYQEKISPPYVYTAWGYLEASGQVPGDLQIGKNVYLATVPNGQIYPELFFDDVSKAYLIVFDADLLSFFTIFSHGLTEICFKDVGTDGRTWPQALSIPLHEILKQDKPTRLIASLLYNVLVGGTATTTESLPPPDISQEVVTANLIINLYKYLIAHELGHIKLGHFSRDNHPGILKREEVDIQRREEHADIFAFAATCNSTGDPEILYSHMLVIYHAMALLYRSAHFLRFQQDYGHVSHQLLHEIYFGTPDRYPHPQKRLMTLRSEIRDKATGVCKEYDKIDELADTFFENLWKPVLLNMHGGTQQLSEKWVDIVSHHERAYENFKASQH